MNNAVIIQHCLSTPCFTGAWSGIFFDMLRLTMQRHAAYARAHQMDYRVIMGGVQQEGQPGAWGKVHLILQALREGYEYVIWLDTDAAIMDFETDLRIALPEGAGIGAVQHSPAKSEYLRINQVPEHLNVGVLYVRNSPDTLKFFEEWASSESDPRWAEQGAFNKLAENNPLVVAVDDRFNATVNVNETISPAVKGWHGVMPPQLRLDMMRQEMADDFIRFRLI